VRRTLGRVLESETPPPQLAYIRGLRKMRFADARRGKGKRGGLRVIYYWWSSGMQFWLYTLYGKDEMADLTARQRATLKAMIKAELESRRAK